MAHQWPHRGIAERLELLVIPVEHHEIADSTARQTETPLPRPPRRALRPRQVRDRAHPLASLIVRLRAERWVAPRWSRLREPCSPVGAARIGPRHTRRIRG